MGKAIVYCTDCGRSLSGDKVLSVENRPYCTACVPTKTDPPPLSSTPRPFAARPARAAGLADTTRRRLPAAASRPAGNAALIAGIAGGILALLVIVVALASAGRPSRSAVPPPPPATVRPAEAERRALAERERTLREAAEAERRRPAERQAEEAAEIERRMQAERARLEAERRERFLADLRRAIEEDGSGARREEIERMIRSARETAGPRAGEVEELARIYEQRLRRPPVDETLVGHWPLDVVQGDRTPETTGKAGPGRLVGNVSAVPGVLGGALEFDGKEAYVELPRTRALDEIHRESYTISAWFRPASRPPGRNDANDAHYGIVVKQGLHVGLSYLHNGTLEMSHWLAEGQPRALAQTQKVFAPGAWRHLAGVVNRPEGTTRFYVNGRLEGTRSWPAGAPSRENKAPWRIGIAAPKARNWGWSCHGAIDDVRLYARALTEEEVQRLFAEGSRQ